MARELDHWLIEDEQGNFFLPDDVEERFFNEYDPEEFEPYDDEHCYEALIP